ncbi:MAG: NAD(P)/FAD-dependent oxidoreductase [Solirubrobacteraceae bacterium]
MSVRRRSTDAPHDGGAPRAPGTTAVAGATRGADAEVSHWWSAAGPRPTRRPLPGGRDADVCIVGAGFTGLWTAYHLARARPGLRIVVLEAHHVGYGASGRNGGWLTAELAGSRERLAGRHGRDAVVAVQRAMQDTVRSVLDVCATEGIACDQHLGGTLEIARNRAQERRLREAVAEDRTFGLGEDDARMLEADEVARRVRVDGARAARFSPHCARIDPARLVLGLAAAVERHGVTIHEDTRVRRIVGANRGDVGAGVAGSANGNGPDPAGDLGSGRNARAVTDRGNVRAPCVLRCTEGFTADLPGERRTWLPLNSSIVITERLEAEAWERIGWRGAETLGDAAHAYLYAQRTADGRIALGGRGVPYRLGSRHDDGGDTPDRTVRHLTEALRAWFPPARDVPIADAWSGVLAVPRDWAPTVALDRAAGVGWAGGYVGTGVAASELAGRTLRDLVLGEETPLTRLPWVRERPRRWEPEPLRWLAVNAVYAMYRAADRREDARSGASDADRDSRLARVADRVAGR